MKVCGLAKAIACHSLIGLNIIIFLASLLDISYIVINRKNWRITMKLHFGNLSIFFLKRTYTHARTPLSLCSFLFGFQWPPPPLFNERTLWMTSIYILNNCIVSHVKQNSNYIEGNLQIFAFRLWVRYNCIPKGEFYPFYTFHVKYAIESLY